MADTLRLDVAMLVGIIMQSFMYGVYQVLFAGCLWVLIYVRGSERINWQMLITALVMWVLITLNFAISWSRIMDAFIYLQPALRENPEAINLYFEDLGHWKEVARTAAYIGLTAVADSLFIYRCYVVWGRNKYIIIPPMLLLCCSIASGIGIEVVIGTVGSTTALFGRTLAVWATSFFSFSLIQNLLTTSLIVFRIWKVHMNVSALDRRHSLWPVITVILESGAIYSSSVLILLTTYVSGSFSQFIALDMLVPITGIVFNLIIVRVGLGLSTNSQGRQPSTTLEPSAVRFRTLQSLNINVSRHLTADRNMTTGSRIGRPRATHDDGSDTFEDNPGWKSIPVAME